MDRSSPIQTFSHNLVGVDQSSSINLPISINTNNLLNEMFDAINFVPRLSNWQVKKIRVTYQVTIIGVCHNKIM